MAKRIILHVGAQKTGSTYVQMRLARNAAALREAGLYYPILPVVDRLVGNAKLIATALNGEPTRIFQHVFPDIDVPKLDPEALVAEMLDDWNPERETLILSAEILRPEHAQRLRALLPPWADITVVLVVRRQDRWIHSYYSQCIKTRDSRSDPQTFVEILLARSKPHLCYPDWSMHHEAWRAAFGDCKTVLFDEVRSDLFGSFFRAAAVPEPAVPDIAPQMVSLDLHQIAYLLAHRNVSFAEFMRRRAASQKAALEAPAADRRSLVSAADISALADRFAPTNRALLAALGRDDDDPALDIPAFADPSVPLEEVYASDGYRQHRMLADSIYA